MTASSDSVSNPFGPAMPVANGSPHAVRGTVARIAVVDDEPDLANLLRMGLSAAGFDVTTFNDPTKVLEAVESESFDGFVVDLMMPKLDGVTLLARMAGVAGPKKLILMSGAAPSARRAAASIAAENGFDLVACLGKPLRLEAVVDTMSAAFAADRIDVDALRGAIAGGELVVYYQPVFHAAAAGQRHPPYFEALVRWAHPSRGILEPASFLPLLEGQEDWRRLTLEVLRQSCAQLAFWRRRGFAPAIAINVPPEILGDPELPDLIDQLVARYELAPERIIFEITEATKFVSDHQARVALTRLKLRGYRLSLDDFGTGHSSLQRLNEAPFDQLKIDISFVREAHRDPQARSIVKSIVELAQALGLVVCAEGVETVEIAETMLDCGCEYLQGYGFGLPSPARMIELQYGFGVTTPKAVATPFQRVATG